MHIHTLKEIVERERDTLSCGEYDYLMKSVGRWSEYCSKHQLFIIASREPCFSDIEYRRKDND